MCVGMVPATGAEALGMLESALGFLAGEDAAGKPPQAVADRLRVLERNDAVQAAVRGRLLVAFDAQDGHLGDGQRTTRTWLVHTTRVTKGQVGEYQAIQALARGHAPLLAALAEGYVLTKSVALQLARWTRAIPDEYRGEAEEILGAAARAGTGLRGLAAICAEIRARTARPDPDDDDDPGLDRGVSLDTTFGGAGVIHGDLTPPCTAMVRGVLDALSAPQSGGDLRTRRQRYHDALAEAMRRLLASDLLPQRAGQPVKALVHISFADLCAIGENSGVQDAWITEYRARWAAHRAAASVSTGGGGAWLDGDAARQVACDAMIIPVVTGDIDPAAVEDLIALCVGYHQLRTQAAPADHDPAAGTPDPAGSQDPPDATGDPAVPAGRPAPLPATPAKPPRPTQPPRSPRRWPRWSSRSWPRSCRSSPGPAGPPRSCAGTCSASPWPGPPCRWTSARPTTSRGTCGAWSRCGTSTASTPAAATSPRPGVNRTTWSTAPTAGTPAWPTSRTTAGGTTTWCCTSWAGP